MTLKRTERMVNSAMALESMRDLGITLQQALTEMADNAIDAGCRHLAFHLDVRENGNLRIVVADDGIGVPMAHPSQPEVKQTLRHVLRFGGRIPHVGRHHPIGRFGFGLSQAITCLTLRTTVYSKTAGHPWRSAVYDFEHLKANDALLMDEEMNHPLADDPMNGAAFVPEDSGTVIVMEDVDRADWQNVKSLQTRLEKDFGRIYRYAIAKGLKLTVTVRDETVEERPSIAPRDPIGQMVGSAEVETFGRSLERGGAEFILDGEDLSFVGERIDPETGLPAAIRVRLFLFDVEKVRAALGIAHRAKLTLKEKRTLGTWGFNREHQGFSIVRSGREVADGQTLGIFTKHSNYNLFRGEVEFPACLDDLFNVQVNKSQYRLDERLEDAFISRLRKTVATIGKEAKKASASLSSRPPKERLPSAEERSVGLRSKVKPRPKLAPKVQKEKTKAYEARKRAVIDEVDREVDEANAAVQQKIDTAKAFGDDALATLLEESKEAIKAAGERRKKDVRHRFSVEAFARKSIKPLRGGDLYHVEDYGERGYWVTINENSDFFSALYDRATQFAEQEALLDLLIFAIAYAEIDPTNSPELQDFWRDAKRNISRLSALFVSMVDYLDDDELRPMEDDADTSGDLEVVGGQRDHSEPLDDGQTTL